MLAQSGPTDRRLVDTPHHYYPREIIDAWRGYMTRNTKGRLQPNVANWSPAASLEEMDKSGVATSILSLASSFGDKWPGDPAYRPVFAELNRRRAVVFFHPYGPNCCGSLNSGVPPGTLEFPYDTGRAITSLLLSGSLTRLREIRWLFSHGGGPMPMLAGRVAYFAGARKDIAEIAPDGVLAELQRFFFDTANAAWPISMAGLLKMVPPSQVLFGTDFPYVPTALQTDALEKNGLSAEALAVIQRDNAARLIPRLAACPGNRLAPHAGAAIRGRRQHGREADE